MSKSSINVYKKDVHVIKIVEGDLKIIEDKNLPCFCTWAGDTKIAIATEYVKDEKSYLVDISTDKIFSCSTFKTDGLPSHIGEPIYVSSKGVLTGEKAGNTLAGVFMGLQNGVVLFKLI